MRYLWALLGVLVLAQSGMAAVILVPQDQPTIQGAINVAASNDTIRVAPGSYTGSFDFGAKGIRLESSAGPYLTSLVPTSTFLAKAGNTGGAPVEISGFSVTTTAVTNLIILTSANNAIIEDNFIHDITAQEAIIRCQSSNVIIRRNIFAFNVVGHACIGLLSQNNQVYNNTFYGNGRGFYSQASGNVAFNNIVVNSTQYGIYGNYARLDYNCVIGNNPNYTDGAAPGVHSISADPGLQSPEAYIFSLLIDSPCVDAGDPSPQYFDLDGSVSDIGAVPFNHNFPLPSAVRVGAHDNIHVLETSPLISWDYVNPEGPPQGGFEIEIGTDPTFTSAVLWQSGVVASNVGEVQYAGVPLERSTTYYGRLRLTDLTDVDDESGFGDWSFFSFHMNTLPVPPVPSGPLPGSVHSVLDVILEVSNGTDAEGDRLLYEFQVSSDPQFINVVATDPAIEEGEQFTSSRRVPNLEMDEVYRWRCRTHDGYEYSDWSSDTYFLTRSPRTFLVPGDFDFIPDAVTAAIHQDTIMVKPGAYNELIEFENKSLVLRSQMGPEATTLTTSHSQPVTFITLNGSDVAPVELFGFTIVSEAQQAAIDAVPGTTARIHHNRFIGGRGTDVLIKSRGDYVEIDHNLFTENIVDGACVRILSGVARIINNTFYDNSNGFESQTALTVAKNNIVVKSTLYGVSGSYAQLDYNDVYNNYFNYYGGTTFPGANSLSVSPLFRDALNGDFRLSPASPCIDAGDPIPTYNDPNGTRNDIGAFPFDDVAPAPFGLLEPIDQIAAPLVTLTPIFSWEESMLPGSEVAVKYTLELSTDSSFNYIWRITDLTETTLLLPGELEWGKRYWWRVIAIGEVGLSTQSNEVSRFRTMTLGDADNSGRLDITDAVYLINYIFAGGAAPNPIVAGNMNCDNRINITDVAYLINYIFVSGPEPCSDWATPAAASASGGESQVKIGFSASAD